MVWCGLDSAGVWLVDKYLENAPVNAPFTRYFIGVSGDHKIAQINRNIDILKNECTGIETQLRKVGDGYRRVIGTEKSIWQNLDKQGRLMRARSPDFDTVFLEGLMSKRREMDMYRGRLKYLRRHITEDETTKSNIVVARNTAGTSLTPVNLEGYFRAVNRAGDEIEPLMGSMGMGDNQLDFQLRMTNSQNAGGEAETDDAFKQEIIRLLTSDQPIESATQQAMGFSMDMGQEAEPSTAKTQKATGNTAIMSEMDEWEMY